MFFVIFNKFVYDLLNMNKYAIVDVSNILHGLRDL